MQDFVSQTNRCRVRARGEGADGFGDGREIVLDTGDNAAYVSGEDRHRHQNLVDAVSRIVVVIQRPQGP